MTAVYLGTMSIAAAVPGAAAAATAGHEGIDAGFADIAARVAELEASIAALAVLPPLPTYPEMLVQANALVTSITLAMSFPGMPPPPSLGTAITALAALVAELTALYAPLSVRLSAIVAFESLLTTAGVHAVASDGYVDDLGAGIDGALATPIPDGTFIKALTLVTTSPATWDAMAAVFKVTP